MKRFCAFVLLLFYVASVSGAAFNLHFCGKKLNSVSFAGFGKKGCCCNKPMTDKNCCKNKQVSIKSGQEHKSSESIHTGLAVTKTVAATLPLFHTFSFAQDSHKTTDVPHPPPNRQCRPALFVLNSTFRI